MALKDDFKNISNMFTVGATITESGASTFTTEQIDLNVDPLSQECIIILGVDMDLQGLSYISGANTAVSCSISTVARTTVGNIADNDVLCMKRIAARTDAVSGVGFESMNPDTPVANGNLDYIGLMVTDNAHLNIEGNAANLAIGTAQVRLYCVRARVKDSGVYAALVQSELLS